MSSEINSSQTDLNSSNEPNDLLLPDVLNPLVAETIFAGKIHHFFSIPSTNTEAMQAAGQGAPEGSVFFTEQQTAGRGRGGHQWESSPSAGIYCSAVLRPPRSPADVLLISMVTGIAVCDAVRELTGLNPDLRWPNDVLFHDRKFCGILTELHAEAKKVHYIVTGIGVNVNQQEFPEEIRPIATSLRLESGRDWPRVEIAAAILKSLDREYRTFVADPARARENIFVRFEQNSSYVRGRPVHVEENGGYEGITAGLDERGFLRVQTANGIRTVLSGGVRPR
jgi:BirA family transcriptional regulator, biotin operon repressor / biotin---[acetyl-CoA-carboxylase] ligase